MGDHKLWNHRYGGTRKFPTSTSTSRLCAPMYSCVLKSGIFYWGCYEQIKTFAEYLLLP